VKTGQSPLILRGELDLADRPHLIERFEQALRLSEDGIIDLTQVTCVDATPLEWLAWADRRATAFDGSVMLTGIGGPVAHLLAITRLDTELTIADSIATAARHTTPYDT